MQRKKRGRKNTPIRYVVEHVYSGTESMEGLLTVVSEEAARRNVEKRLRGNMETESYISHPRHLYNKKGCCFGVKL